MSPFAHGIGTHGNELGDLGVGVAFSAQHHDAGAGREALRHGALLFGYGDKLVLRERRLTIAPGVSGNESFAETLPQSLAEGDYQLTARAEVRSESFDEDIVMYRVE